MPAPAHIAPKVFFHALSCINGLLPRLVNLHLSLFFMLLPLSSSSALTALSSWADSNSIENFLRGRIISVLQDATGARVEIGSFQLHLATLEAEAGGIVLHGLEAPNEEPYAKVESLRLRLSWKGIWSQQLFTVNELDLRRPLIHLIVYADGATNLPAPRKAAKNNSSMIDDLFDLKAGRIGVEQGVLHYENRAAAFDFQNRFIPLDLTANDLSLRMSYQPAQAKDPESFHIEAGVSDLNLLRGTSAQGVGSLSRRNQQLVQGRLQTTLDLTRSAAYLRALRLTAHNDAAKDQTLEITGSLSDFSHPRWQGKCLGLLDMRLLDGITGYPFAPQGIARLNLDGQGQAGQFRLDGSIQIDGGAYIGTGIYSTGIALDAHLHADPEQLLITNIVARLRQGGQISGAVALAPWLPPTAAAVQLRAPANSHPRAANAQPKAVLKRSPRNPDIIEIPVNGKVNARFENVALDTILEMTAQRPFQHLGFDTRLNGPAIATWTAGDVRTLSVASTLSLAAPEKIAPGKVAASGVIDGTYAQRDGAVDLRKLELHLPASAVQAHGRLGAFPMTSPSSLAVDFQSANLSEFDTVLRDLGFTRNGEAGVAALPVSLTGQAEFHGQWTGSLINPRLAGAAQAENISIELPAAAKKSAAPRTLAWDSIQAAGSYSATRIAIDHGELRQGSSLLNVTGTLDAAPSRPPTFDANSIAHLRVSASKVALRQLLPLTGLNLPLDGNIDTAVQLDGPLHALNGSGWVDLVSATVYGEPFDRIHAAGGIQGRLVSLSTLTATHPAGTLNATGAYDLESRRFSVEASGAGIDMSRIEHIRALTLPVTGKLGFTVSGSGTIDDPRLTAHAEATDLIVDGQRVGGVELNARTANHSVLYDLASNLEAAQLTAHGETRLSSEMQTQAQIDFSRFNVGPLFKLAHVKGLYGESSLAGSFTLDGPLAHLAQIHGDLRLNELALTISGVPLHSDAGLHAALTNSRIQLDPLHITGEQTDMRIQGSVILASDPQLDLAANGAINLQLAEMLDSDLTATGTTAFEVEAHGPLKNPNLLGHVDIQDASISLEDLPNGLSHLHGSLEFNQNRLEVKSLTAVSGGGQLSVAGYLAYQHGLYADLSVDGKGIRIRYPQGVSSLADGKLHLQGPQANLLLSGDVLITRFSVSPDLDVAALTASARAVQAFAPPDAPSNHIRLDVHFTSSPQLNFQNAFAKLAGDVDLHLRGTLASPSLLGRVTITEGSAMIAGTRYELQRGEVSFTNPVRIQPNIDLNATARVEDYDITLGLHGTLDKPSITYRSDPPLAEADVVALLALGRTEDQQRIYTQQQEQSGANPTDALLGGALNATVSSRVQKLFGAGSVKVDPNYLGALGNSTSRVIVEEQLGGNVTLTYATNVNATAQQLIQAEIAINRHISVLVARDESGVFSIVVKATRRYR